MEDGVRELGEPLLRPGVGRRCHRRLAAFSRSGQLGVEENLRLPDLERHRAGTGRVPERPATALVGVHACARMMFVSEWLGVDLDAIFRNAVQCDVSWNGYSGERELGNVSNHHYQYQTETIEHILKNKQFLDQ